MRMFVHYKFKQAQFIWGISNKTRVGTAVISYHTIIHGLAPPRLFYESNSVLYGIIHTETVDTTGNNIKG